MMILILIKLVHVDIVVFVVVVFVIEFMLIIHYLFDLIIFFSIQLILIVLVGKDHLIQMFTYIYNIDVKFYRLILSFIFLFLNV